MGFPADPTAGEEGLDRCCCCWEAGDPPTLEVLICILGLMGEVGWGELERLAAERAEGEEETDGWRGL